MSNLVVIDGCGLFNRFYSAGEPTEVRNEKDITKKNQLCDKLMRKNIHGVFTNVLGPNVGNYGESIPGIVSTILNIQKELKADYFVVVFDKSSKTTFRKQQYPEYKANRPEKPNAYKEQIKSLKDILDHIGIVTFWADLYEADDLAGSLIKKFKYDVDQVYFVTADHDWLQLVDTNVTGLIYQQSEERATKLRNDYKTICPMNDDGARIWNGGIRPLKKTVAFNSAVTVANDGVYPKLIPDLKALSGDKSDNIPGVKGIGTETAIILLRCFNTLESIYDAIDKCQSEEDAIDLEHKIKSFGIKKSPLKALIQGRQFAMLSKSLATICTDIPIPFDIEKLRYHLKEDQLKIAIDWYGLDDCKRFLSEPEQTVAPW